MHPNGPHAMRLAAAGLVAVLALPAIAQSLQQSGTMRWVVVASRQNLDEAIGIAKTYEDAKVVQSVNGWYGVVTGPRAVTNQAALKNQLVKDENFPKDLVFSKGDNYTALVWQSRRIEPSRSVALEGEPGTKTMTAGGLTVTLTTLKDKEGEHTPVVTGMIGGRTVFTARLDDGKSEAPRAEAKLYRLDPASPQPQVMITAYTGGAHCCTVTQIATADAAGNWKVLEGGTLDGGAYAVEDADGDGVPELTHRDNSFLYAFASYAGSVAPMRIKRVFAGTLADVTREPRYQPYLRQEVAGIEHLTVRYGPGEANGYYAGWVAAKALIGEVEAAWPVMLQRQDRNPPMKPQKCSVNRKLEECPQDKLVDIPFPEALRAHLSAGGYPVPR